MLQQWFGPATYLDRFSSGVLRTLVLSPPSVLFWQAPNNNAKHYDDVLSRNTGVSWIRCALHQYLSGLAFSIDPTENIYLWSARCTNLMSLLATQRERGFAGYRMQH